MIKEASLPTHIKHISNLFIQEQLCDLNFYLNQIEITLNKMKEIKRNIIKSMIERKITYNKLACQV